MEQFTLSTTIKNDVQKQLECRIEEAIQAFSTVTDIPVTYFDIDGDIQWECHSDNRFCNHFEIYKDADSICSCSLRSSAKIAAQLGEPYIFLCRAGLAKIAVSLILQGEIQGCFMAGPILMGELKESIFSNIFSLNNLHPDSFAKVTMCLKGMHVFKPKEVSYLATLLGNSILGAITPNPNYLSINKQYQEHQRMGENLQRYKRGNKNLPYPYEVESQLIQNVRNGNIKESLNLLQSFLEEISLLEMGDLASIRTKILGLCSALSRLASEKANLTQEETEAYFYDMDAINQAGSISELSALSSSFVEHVARTFAVSSYSGNSQIVKQAIRRINENYKDKLSLKSLAVELHTSAPYLSTLFKKETTTTITDYINNIRIKKSCELLSDTTLNLLDISSQSGFDDQSYFTKVFKKINGITPKEYRKLHSQQ